MLTPRHEFTFVGLHRPPGFSTLAAQAPNCFRSPASGSGRDPGSPSGAVPTFRPGPLAGLVAAPVAVPELAGQQRACWWRLIPNPDSAADRFLVAVHGGCINQPVADVNGVCHRLLSHGTWASEKFRANTGNRHPLFKRYSELMFLVRPSQPSFPFRLL